MSNLIGGLSNIFKLPFLLWRYILDMKNVYRWHLNNIPWHLTLRLIPSHQINVLVFLVFRVILPATLENFSLKRMCRSLRFAVRFSSSSYCWSGEVRYRRMLSAGTHIISQKSVYFSCPVRYGKSMALLEKQYSKKFLFVTCFSSGWKQINKLLNHQFICSDLDFEGNVSMCHVQTLNDWMRHNSVIISLQTLGNF